MPCCSSEVLLVKCAVISVRPTGLSCILLSSSKRVRSQHGWGLSAIRTSKLACRVISLPHSVLFGRLPCWRVSRRTRCAACGALLAVLTLLPAVPVRFIRARLSGGLQPRGVAFHPCAAFRWLAAARGFLRGLAPVQLFAREALSFFFFGAWVCARLGLQKAPDRGWGPGSRSCPELPGQTGRHPFPMIRRMRGRLG